MTNPTSQIIDKFLESQNRLVTQSSDLSLESIASMVENEAIDVSPGYQRRERWSNIKESALIESFLLNIPVPPIYLAEDEYGRYTVIDGKQRVSAIHKFLKRNLKLKNLQRFFELENYSFDELPPQLKNAISIRPYLRVVTLLNQSDPNLKYEVFTRLNTGGDNLLPQEVRNVAFRGPLNDLIYHLSENDFLRRQLKIINKSEKPYKQMVDAEYVLRFFTLRDLWYNFPGNMNVAMNLYMDRNRIIDETEITRLNNIFLTTINYCKDIWGDNAFMRFDGDQHRKLILQGFYDVQMVPISLIVDKGIILTNDQKQAIRNAFVLKYETDASFQDSIRQFTSNSERVKYRIGTMNALIYKIVN
ncbi:DUF262 domain-containing protein [Mucilaginibacter sp.]|uniref:DUF262 domain-containing protein n=1 Tax=Mucilaginibacter sp. TaxID=1882438 RepID=UPI0025E13255|nr:DUF262 domain-containing protein [Mucilaginibacter sp.]